MEQFFSYLRFLTVMVCLTFMVKYICSMMIAKYKSQGRAANSEGGYVDENGKSTFRPHAYGDKF